MSQDAAVVPGPPEPASDATELPHAAEPIAAQPSAAVVPLAVEPLEPIEAAAGLSAPVISWRVENPFRFFTDPAATARHREAFKALSPAEQARTPVLAAERQLAAATRNGWAADVVDKTCWDPWRNRHDCTGTADFINPTSHRILASVTGVPDAREVGCEWVKRPRDKASGRVETLSGRCDAEVAFDVPYPAGADIEVTLGGRVLASAPAVVSDLFIVGMGDSFGSGEGNPDVPVRFDPERTADYGKPGQAAFAGYPARIGGWQSIGDPAFQSESARWIDQACHRSLYSHQLRAALQLAVEDDHRAVTYVGLACSGAEVINGLFLRYKGNEWVPNPPDLSQISAAAEEQCGKARSIPQDLPEAYHMGGALEALRGLVLNKCPAEKARRIDLLMVSIGGNDIGFARLLANAIIVDQSLLKQLGGWVGQVHGAPQARAALGLLTNRYKALNRAIHNILHVPWNESDRIILTAYPELAVLGDGTRVCPDGPAGMDVVQDFALSSKRAQEGISVSDRLHGIMRRSSSMHGWTFVDAHRPHFVGRGICAGYTRDAFSVADDLRLPRLIDGRWTPYSPADYRPYAQRQRWFRTPNDAFLTGNFHVAGSLLQKVLKLESLSWFQLLLASTYSGAFHPTAEGHAAIADAVVQKARRVLSTYERRHPASVVVRQ